MKKRRFIAICFGFSLLATGLVIEAKSIYDLKKERNVIQAANTELRQQIEYHKTMHEELQEQYNGLMDQNRSLQQEVDDLKEQLEQAKENQWLSFRATYYDAYEPSTGKKPGDPGFGITRSGRPVTEGVTIAVDPKVIPLGSWVEIMYPDGTIERRRADDTGGLIKGRRIDIYVPKATLAMGVDEVKVRMISKPGKNT
jgi:3D (Asp-Asp-Asp) domain-containing protein